MVMEIRDRRFVYEVQGEDEVRRRIVDHPKGATNGPFGERIPCAKTTGFGHWEPTDDDCVSVCPVNAECACVRLKLRPKVVEPKRRRRKMNPCPWPAKHLGAEVFEALCSLIKGKRSSIQFRAEDLNLGLEDDDLDYVDDILQGLSNPDFLYPAGWDVARLQCYWDTIERLGESEWAIDPSPFRKAQKEAQKIDRSRY